MDLQAQARAHRLGQTRAVMIYRCENFGRLLQLLERRSPSWCSHGRHASPGSREPPQASG